MLTFFAAIEQPYSAADIIMNDAHVMLDNSVTLACSVPAHLSDHVTVVAWRVDESGLPDDPIELNMEPASYGSVHNLHGTRSPNVLKGPRLQMVRISFVVEACPSCIRTFLQCVLGSPALPPKTSVQRRFLSWDELIHIYVSCKRV